MGDSWNFKENNYGKALLSKINLVDSEKKIDIYKFNEAFKKHFFDRIDLIRIQYNNRFENEWGWRPHTHPEASDIEPPRHKLYKPTYDKFLKNIEILRRNLSDNFLKKLIQKINLPDDVKINIFNYIRFRISEYIRLRNKIDEFREVLRNITNSENLLYKTI